MNDSLERGSPVFARDIPRSPSAEKAADVPTPGSGDDADAFTEGEAKAIPVMTSQIRKPTRRDAVPLISCGPSR